MYRGYDYYRTDVFSAYYKTVQDKSAVLVHEQFCDQTRKKRRWEDNFTNVIYTCAQRGLPNSWTAASDLSGFEYMVYKLGTSE